MVPVTTCPPPRSALWGVAGSLSHPERATQDASASDGSRRGARDDDDATSDAARLSFTAVTLVPTSKIRRPIVSAAVLTTGTTVTVVGYPNRNQPEEMRAERITVAGKTVELR